MHQQNGCVRTQFSENVCVIQNIVVPLHRQKKKAQAKRAAQQDNIIKKVGAKLYTALSKEKKG